MSDRHVITDVQSAGIVNTTLFRDWCEADAHFSSLMEDVHTLYAQWTTSAGVQQQHVRCIAPIFTGTGSRLSHILGVG